MPKRVLIIGGGPAGLSAAIALGTEGIPTTLLRAGDYRAYVSPNLENIPGIAAITGAGYQSQLVTKAHAFGHLTPLPPDTAIRLEFAGHSWVVGTKNGRQLAADAVIIATGIQMDHPTSPQPAWCKRIFVAGGGDAAVQCALGHAADRSSPMVTLVVRGKSLDRCSHYLQQRVREHKGLSVLYETTARLQGDTVTLVKGEIEWDIPNACLQTLIGGKPDIRWAEVATDRHGFIATGGIGAEFMTSRLGVFAAGDVRSGTIKRIAVAAGEGIAVGHTVARWLREQA